MNKEKYIKSVLKYVNCSRKEKKKIKNDLSSDICQALDNGETWQEVKERLGSPKDLAEELNENFQYYQKSHKKTILISICVCIVIIAGVFLAYHYFTPQAKPLENSQIYQENDLDEKIKDVLNYVNHFDYDKLMAVCNEEMKNSLDKNSLKSAIEQLGELGEYQKITSQHYYEMTSKGEKMVVCEVVALYQNRSVTYTISFDQDMKLAGLYMK